MSIDLGRVCSVLVRRGGQRLLLVGRLTHLSGNSAVLACTEAASEGISQRAKLASKGADALRAKDSGAEIDPVFFVRVASQHLRAVPEAGIHEYSLVPLGTALASWYANSPTVESSDSELQTAAEDSTAALRAEIQELKAAMARQAQASGGATSSRPPLTEQSPNPLAALFSGAGVERRLSLFANVDGLWKPTEGDADDDEDELEDFMGPEAAETGSAQRNQGIGWNPPGGGTAAAAPSQQRKTKPRDRLDFQQTAMASQAQGGNLDDALKMLMMAQQLGKKRRGAATSSNGGSNDEDELGLVGQPSRKKAGLKAAREMQELKDRITKEPLRLVREFEETAQEDLGTLDGMAWTLRDWVEKQFWGKFKSLQRAAPQDVAVYQYLRQNQPKAALAQLVQNLKSKPQAALDSGDWGTAWLLCGLPDPPRRREFIGNESEMAIIAGYEKSLIEVRKKQRRPEQPFVPATRQRRRARQPVAAASDANHGLQGFYAWSAFANWR
eukprot:TRINITY_DN8694_c0_g3_i1.p1 TRINITY_DN8694_c0_g3~~TRINITY_DN8694_c0_g3_i1.p1  ORF type:complete len:499 (-),score=89.49 TRINITY_DN8694_c0_g3_i1:543-2039(-)